ncbi:S-layer homology domain-containing protein [Paenibacillus sp. FSL H8-0034]|uniref:S-layer homology domain-containing protein n=1 Tax=Paenibacillus sp. FSL H8-0034 TaxID=2954671 RepID=UPI0030F9384E
MNNVQLQAELQKYARDLGETGRDHLYGYGVVSLVKAAAPSIATQPTSATVNVGDSSPTMSVAATASDGGTLSYQWCSNTTNITSGGTPITNATSASYVVPTATAGTTYYYVIVTNTNNSATGSNTATTTSNVATVTVNELVNAATPSIDTQTTGATVNVGTLSVVASVSDGGTLSYQWCSNTTNSITGGVEITNATNASYAVPTTTAGTTYYYVIVTNTSNSATGSKTATATSSAAVVNDVVSQDASLSSLNLSSGVLSPAFASYTTNYTATVPNDVSVTEVTCNTADSHATVELRLDGASVNNPVKLSVGSNIISVVVTAQDSTPKTYNVTVTRAASNNAVLSSLNLSGITLDQALLDDVYAYTASVPYDVSVTTATYAATESHATVALSLNGTPVDNPISLDVGDNIISFVVTAQDGTVQTYTVTVTREPQLDTNIPVSNASETMYVGDSLQFNAKVTPDNVTDKTFSWSVVPGRRAATISDDELLVATQVGTVTVQATAHDGSGIVGSKVITISKRSTNSGSHTTSPTDIEPTPEFVQNPDSTTNSTTDVFRSNVVQGDMNVVKNIEMRIQEAKTDPTVANFSDINWAEKTIDTFVKLHVIEGYDDGTFKPNGNITRAEFAVILNRVFDINAGDNTNVELRDAGSHWAKDAIEKLVKAGIISCYDDGTFKPDKTITREEMVVMLSRLVNFDNVMKDATKGNFNDLVRSYAANEIKAEAQAGIISGKGEGKLDPPK